MPALAFDFGARPGDPLARQRALLDGSMRLLRFVLMVTAVASCTAARVQVPDTRLPEPDHGVPTAEAPAPSSPPGALPPPAEDRAADKPPDEPAQLDDKQEAHQQDHEPSEPPGDDSDDETTGLDTDDDATDDAQGRSRPPSQ